MVRDLVSSSLKNTAEVLFRRQTSITNAAIIIIVLSLASRILGLIRYRVMLGHFGSDSPELAAFNSAFRIPDIIFQVLIIGALATAFIPVITGYITKREESEAWKIFNTVISYALIATAIFSVIVFILAEPIASLLSIGYSTDAKVLTAHIIRILMLAQFFLIVSNFLTGMLNAYHRFLIPALAPLVYNLGIIFGTMFLSDGLGIYGPVVGVVIGAAAHFLIQVPLIKRLGGRFEFSLNWSIPGVRQVFKLMTPRALGLAVSQLDPLVDNAMATIAQSASAYSNVNVYTFAFNLQALPAGVFGYALGVAALPTLSKEFAKENIENFKTTLITSLNQIMYLVIPTVAVMIVLRIPIVRLLFGTPKFTWEDTKLTAFTLAAFSIGILGQAAIQLLARGFYAMHDTKTPLKISLLTVALNVILSVVLVLYFNSVVVLGVSSTVAGIFNALLLLYYLDKRVGGFEWRKILGPIGKMGLAGILAGFSLYTPLKILDSASYGQLWLQGSIVHTFLGPLSIDTSHTVGLLIVTLISAILGLLVYFLVTYILQVEEITIFTRILRKLRNLPPLRKLEEMVSQGPVTSDQ